MSKVNFIELKNTKENGKYIVEKIAISDEMIDDIMASALDGGIGYWCDNCKVVGGTYLGEYASDQISRGGELQFHCMEPYDNEGNTFCTLTKEKFLEGVKATYNEYGHKNKWFTKILEESTENMDMVIYEIDVYQQDSVTADCIVQLALWQKIVFA